MKACTAQGEFYDSWLCNCRHSLDTSKWKIDHDLG